MREVPKCALCEKEWQPGILFILCKVKGFDKPVFICGKCYMTNKRVVGRIRAI